MIRSSTCPSLGLGGPRSPKSGGRALFPGLLSRQRAWQLGAEQQGWLVGLLGSRAFLLIAAALYALALLGLPVMYSSFGRAQLGSDGSALSPQQQQQQQPPQLALLSNRRLTLQPAAGAAVAMWPTEAALALEEPGGLPAHVEFRDAGHIVTLADALNASRWHEQPLYQPSEIAHPVAPQPNMKGGPGVVASPGEGGAGSGGGQYPPWCPQSEIRLFIGITSRCCTAEAQAKRAAIRETWAAAARARHPDIAIRFVLAQPAGDADAPAALRLLRGEAREHGDLIIVPGPDTYRALPSKTLQLLRYALSSPCRYTHVLKTDDDVHLRPQGLLDIIATGRHAFSVSAGPPVDPAVFDGREPASLQAPWLSGMYLGQLDSNRSGLFPGWAPDRDPRSKWFLTEDDLPDGAAPLGVRWASGWGYLLSRDLAELISSTAALYAAAPHTKPAWWGRMPWEDIMVGAMLADVARVHHHPGFKAAWQECDAGTVLKHLDNDAPALQQGLAAQERSGLWARKAVVCSSGDFDPGNHTQWRAWRNSLPDNQVGGFM